VVKLCGVLMLIHVAFHQTHVNPHIGFPQEISILIRRFASKALPLENL